MKKAIAILVLGLLFISAPSYADDIRDFQIEGISIGDSILDYFTKEEIERNKWDYFKSKKFTPLQFNHVSFAETYDAVDIQYKTNDKNFKVSGISGIILYKYNISDCYAKMDSVVNEMEELFKNIASRGKKTVDKHTGTKDAGKSKVTGVYFTFASGDGAAIQCYDYSQKSGDDDHLRVNLNTKEYIYFLRNEAY